MALVISVAACSSGESGQRAVQPRRLSAVSTTGNGRVVPVRAPAPPVPVPAGAVQEFDGPADCSVDVTASLNQFIAAVPDGATVAFRPAGCYRVDGQIEVTDRNRLTFDGRGARFTAERAATRRGPHWGFFRGGDLVFRDMTVRGASAKGGPGTYDGKRGGETGMNFAGTVGVTIERVTIENVYGDFLYFGSDRANHRSWTRKVAVTDSTMRGSSRQGIAITGGSDIRIEGNTIDGIGRSVFDVEPNAASGGAQRVLIAGNTVSRWQNALLPMAGRGRVTDIELRANSLIDQPIRVTVRALSVMRDGPRRVRIAIVDNRSTGTSGNPIAAVQDTDWLLVMGNVQAFEADKREPAVATERTCGITVTGNQFTGSARTLQTRGYESDKATRGAGVLCSIRSLEGSRPLSG